MLKLLMMDIGESFDARSGAVVVPLGAQRIGGFGVMEGSLNRTLLHEHIYWTSSKTDTYMPRGDMSLPLLTMAPVITAA